MELVEFGLILSYPSGRLARLASRGSTSFRKSRRQLPWVLGVGLWLTFSLQLLANGPNLLSNPTFDSGLGAWSPVWVGATPGSASWAPSDSAGSIDSGSVKLTSTSDGGYGVGQCVPVVGGTSYVWAAKAWIPVGDPAQGVPADAVVEWFPTSDCSGTTSIGAYYLTFYNRGRWEDGAATMEAPPSARSALIVLHKEFSARLVYFDNAFFGTGTCAPSSTRLCLNEGRFQVEVTWTTRDGTTGPGMAVPFAGDSGSYWFFSPSNIELDVKVLNACVTSLGNHFWVFAAGLTDVKVVVTITDTKTGVLRTYTNQQGSVFQPITDTNAFSTCP